MEAGSRLLILGLSKDEPAEGWVEARRPPGPSARPPPSSSFARVLRGSGPGALDGGARRLATRRHGGRIELC